MKIKKYDFLIIIIALVVILLLYSILFNFGIVIPCIFRKLTGLYCPGCGVTRMIFSLLKLDFYQAFRYNNLVFLFMPFFLFYFIDFVVKKIKNNAHYLYLKIDNKVWIILLIITLVFGIVRNISGFEYLIPTVV